jgi:hypothetical protein
LAPATRRLEDLPPNGAENAGPVNGIRELAGTLIHTPDEPVRFVDLPLS